MSRSFDDEFIMAVKKSKSLSISEDGSILDGDIWLFFNNSDVDTHVSKSDAGGMVMDQINAVKVKSAGSPLPDFNTIMNMKVKTMTSDGKFTSKGSEMTVWDKIRGYVPADTLDSWKELEPGETEDEGEPTNESSNKNCGKNVKWIRL